MPCSVGVEDCGRLERSTHLSAVVRVPRRGCSVWRMCATPPEERMVVTCGGVHLCAERSRPAPGAAGGAATRQVMEHGAVHGACGDRLMHNMHCHD